MEVVSGEFSLRRMLHSTGPIQLCVDKSRSSSSFLSCGVDGDVCVWNSVEDDEYRPRRVGERTHAAIAWHTSCDLLTSIEKQNVARFSYPELTFATSLLTFSLDSTAIDVGCTGKFLVSGAGDFAVKCINLEADGEYERFECDGSILSVAVDPRDEYFAVSSADGFVRIWSVRAAARSAPAKTLRYGEQFTDARTDRSRCQLCWSIDGSQLYIPCKGQIKILTRQSWMEKPGIKDEKRPMEIFSICCVSADDKFLASCSLTCVIYVWRLSDNLLLSRSEHYRSEGKLHYISSMIWHPSISDCLILADVDEHMCSLSKCLGAMTVTNEESARLEASPIDKKRHSLPDYYDDDDDENTRGSVDLAAIKASCGFGTAALMNEREALTSAPVAPTTVIAFIPPKLPKFFIPGSSPEHLSQRYLKWNTYGIVRSFQTEDENIIEIDFHDASVHPQITIENSESGYSIADITNDAVALASKCNDVGPSEMEVRVLAAWDAGSRRWNVQLPIDEEAEALVIGRAWIVLYTSMRFVRLFTLAGCQRLVTSEPGPIVSLCAFDDQLAMISIRSQMLLGENKAEVQLSARISHVEVGRWCNQIKPVLEVPIALGKDASLEWIGYSNRGSLCTMDSYACVRLLSPSGQWIPILMGGSTLLQSPSDSIWPLAIKEHPNHQLRYVYCKGQRYPLVSARLAPAFVQWSLPLCQAESEKSRLESELLLNEIRECDELLDGDEHMKQQMAQSNAAILLRLFALACKSERDCRALELASMASNASRTIQMMCNYASKSRHTLLAEKVAEIGRQMTTIIEDEGTRENEERPVSNQRLELNRRRRENMEYDEEKEEAMDQDSVAVIRLREDDIVKLDRSLVSASPSLCPPMPSRNPFKRSIESSNDISLNVLNTLASPTPQRSMTAVPVQAKRAKPGVIKSSTSKQSTLPFVTSINTLRASENTPQQTTTSPYQCWFSSNEMELRSLCPDKQGDRDFVQFATRQFMSLSNEEKKHWQHKATEAVMTQSCSGDGDDIDDLGASSCLTDGHDE